MTAEAPDRSGTTTDGWKTCSTEGVCDVDLDQLDVERDLNGSGARRCTPTPGIPEHSG